MKDTPKNLDYQMPAEWAPHTATWLAWPYDKITFPDRVAKVEQIYCQIIKVLAEQEKINIIIREDEEKNKILDLLAHSQATVGHWQNIKFHICDYADVWLRDYGPTFLKNSEGKKAWVKWDYNAYSNKFPDLLKDNEVFNLIDKNINGTKFVPGLVMEGGSIEVNGQGVVLTTEECLLNSNRNPGLSKPDAEKLLKEYLGVDKIIWLKQGLVNDHTDGHIDIIAKFVNPDTILVASTDDKNNPNYERLLENYHILSNETTLSGNKLNIVKLPIPNVNYDNGELAPASYINFYIANNCLLVPSFGTPSDKEANKIIGHYFSDRPITNIDCNDLLYGGGAIHCITQQEPT